MTLKEQFMKMKTFREFKESGIDINPLLGDEEIRKHFSDIMGPVDNGETDLELGIIDEVVDLKVVFARERERKANHGER